MQKCSIVLFVKYPGH